MLGRHPRVSALAAASTLAALVVAPLGGGAAAHASSGGTAFGRPGADADYLPADKSGFGTAYGTGSDVWYTLEHGEMSEVYYPDLSTPATKDLQLIVTDGRTFTENERSAAYHRTRLIDSHALVYRQIDTEKRGRWQVIKTYATDPARSSVTIHVTFRSLTHRPYRVFVYYDPDLSNNGNDDSARTVGSALTAWDSSSASTLVATPAFTRLSNGYLGTSDGWTDLRGDHRMDWTFGSAPDGNVVQTARTVLNGVGTTSLTLSLGFGTTASESTRAATATAAAGFWTVERAYAATWHGYLAGLKQPPASLRTALERETYLASAMVLAASEDKRNRGAFVASPTMPWAWGFNDQLASPTGPYHLVWPRDLYEIATGLIADGDTPAANRALDYMWNVQQQPDGHLAQNTKVDGTPYWTNIQLDETADPVILSWQLGRTDAATWQHVKRALTFILGYSVEGHAAPYTQQERWENQSGYSPATIASEIAALVCGADIAKANGDTATAQHYLDVADTWQRKVDGWTVTHNGPYSPKPYYLRLTKDGNPDAGTTYSLGDSSFSAIDQRAVVDPSFLELVRLGVKPASDPVVRNSLAVVDSQLAVRTPNGTFWHRYTGDGYGEQRDGKPWNIGFPNDSHATIGRAWPIFAGERGEYELLAGQPAGARLAAMAAAGNSGYLLPEQVWDQNPPSGHRGFTPGEGTRSATPLAWTHAQYIRLAWSIQAGHPVEQPSVVACRYAEHC